MVRCIPSLLHVTGKARSRITWHYAESSPLHVPISLTNILISTNGLRRLGLLRWARRTIVSPARIGFVKAATLGQPVEEETLPNYDPNEFYPIHIGEVLRDKYQVLGKLEFGASSTVWLCRDLHHVAVKIYIKTRKIGTNREVLTYQRLSSIRSSHAGQAHIRQLLDSFPTAHYISDIKLSNIMLSINDKSVLDDFEEAEQKSPCPRKTVSADRTIYASRSFRHPTDHNWGLPVLCDLGEARIGGSYTYEEIQPEVYKAPKIIMQTDWSHAVDIWNLACVIWDMMENKHLFDARDKEDLHNNRFHVAEMIAYLGDPPKGFQRRSPKMALIFDREGNWKGDPPISSLSLEESVEQLEGADKVAFLRFIRKMMTWLPEERGTARELLKDPWLNG